MALLERKFKMAAPVTSTSAKAQPLASTKPSLIQEARVISPGGTISIQLMPAPIAPTPLYANSAIVVPIFTLFGVGATVLFGIWKTRKELGASENKWKVDRDDAIARVERDRIHAAEEARKARLVIARRDVYLELIKEMTAASMELGGMPFKKGDDLEVQEGFKGFLSAVARVAILGEMDTVVKSRELMKLVQDVLYKKLPEIGEMRFIKTRQEKLQKAEIQQLEKSEAVKTILADLLNNVSAAGIVEREKNALLKSWSDALADSDAGAKHYGEQAIECERQYLILARAYQRSIIDDTVEIAQKTNELIVCIRSELELSTENCALESSTADIYAAIKASVEKMQACYD